MGVQSMLACAAVVLLIVTCVCPPVGASELPQNETCEFLGPQHEWTDIEIAVHDGAPLFGSGEIYLTGEGLVSLIQVGRDVQIEAREKRYELSGKQVQVQELIEKLCRADALIERAAAAHPPSCSGTTTLVVRNAAGDVRAVDFPRRERGTAYDQAWRATSAFTRLSAETAPVYDGPYDADHIPARAAWWATTAIAPLKQIQWTLIQTDERNARAAADAEIRDAYQREQIERMQQDEEDAR